MKALNLLKLTFVVLLFSCNKVKEGMQDAVTNAVENAIEKKTGTQVDLPDTDEMADNAGFLNYKSASKTYFTDKEKMQQATVVFQKDNYGLSIGFQMAGENGKSFLATISNVSEEFTLPLIAKFSIVNKFDGINPTANISFMKVNNYGMKSFDVPFEAEMVITKLSKHDVAFEIKGKGRDPTNSVNPSNWIVITANGKLIQPII
jgi:hypothetical protein